LTTVLAELRAGERPVWCCRTWQPIHRGNEDVNETVWRILWLFCGSFTCRSSTAEWSHKHSNTVGWGQYRNAVASGCDDINYPALSSATQTRRYRVTVLTSSKCAPYLQGKAKRQRTSIFLHLTDDRMDKY